MSSPEITAFRLRRDITILLIDGNIERYLAVKHFEILNKKVVRDRTSLFYTVNPIFII